MSIGISAMDGRVICNLAGSPLEEVAHPLGYKKDALSVKIKRPYNSEVRLAWRMPQTYHILCYKGMEII